MKKKVQNKQKTPLSGIGVIIATCAGCISVALGLVVLIGWHTESKTLIQIIPVFVPMQYNAAIGFVLCGSSML
ncbi:MAG: hypothetical protein ACUZ8H_08040 [Candidatus Anammoxibacter sp.]